MKEAEEYAQQDTAECKEVEIGIKAENMIRAGQKTIEDAGEDIDISLINKVEKGMLEVKAAIAGGDSQEVEQKTKELAARIKVLDRAIKGAKKRGVKVAST